jgi:hypothetical protein
MRELDLDMNAVELNRNIYELRENLVAFLSVDAFDLIHVFAQGRKHHNPHVVGIQDLLLLKDKVLSRCKDGLGLGF